MDRVALVAGIVSGLWFEFDGEVASARLLRFCYVGHIGGFRCGFQGRGSALAHPTGLCLPWSLVPNPYRPTLCKAGYEEGQVVGQASDNTQLQRDRSRVPGAPQA